MNTAGLYKEQMITMSGANQIVGSPTGLVLQLSGSQILIRDHAGLQQQAVIEGDGPECTFFIVATSADGQFIAAGGSSKKRVISSSYYHTSISLKSSSRPIL